MTQVSVEGSHSLSHIANRISTTADALWQAIVRLANRIMEVVRSFFRNPPSPSASAPVTTSAVVLHNKSDDTLATSDITAIGTDETPYLAVVHVHELINELVKGDNTLPTSVAQNLSCYADPQKCQKAFADWSTQLDSSSIQLKNIHIDTARTQSQKQQSRVELLQSDPANRVVLAGIALHKKGAQHWIQDFVTPYVETDQETLPQILEKIAKGVSQDSRSEQLSSYVLAILDRRNGSLSIVTDKAEQAGVPVAFLLRHFPDHNGSITGDPEVIPLIGEGAASITTYFMQKTDMLVVGTPSISSVPFRTILEKLPCYELGTDAATDGPTNSDLRQLMLRNLEPFSSVISKIAQGLTPKNTPRGVVVIRTDAGPRKSEYPSDP